MIFQLRTGRHECHQRLCDSCADISAERKSHLTDHNDPDREFTVIVGGKCPFCNRDINPNATYRDTQIVQLIDKVN